MNMSLSCFGSVRDIPAHYWSFCVKYKDILGSHALCSNKINPIKKL